MLHAKTLKNMLARILPAAEHETVTLAGNGTTLTVETHGTDHAALLWHEATGAWTRPVTIRVDTADAAILAARLPNDSRPVVLGIGRTGKACVAWNNDNGVPVWWQAPNLAPSKADIAGLARTIETLGPFAGHARFDHVETIRLRHAHLDDASVSIRRHPNPACGRPVRYATGDGYLTMQAGQAA